MDFLVHFVFAFTSLSLLIEIRSVGERGVLVQGWGQKVPEASLQEGWSGAGSLMAVSDEDPRQNENDPSLPARPCPQTT